MHKYFVVLEAYFVVQSNTGVVFCNTEWFWSSMESKLVAVE